MPVITFRAHLDNPGNFSDGPVVKNLSANAGDGDSIPELGRSPKEGHGNPLQYSCLGNPTDGGAWQAIVHGVTKSPTQLRNLTFFPEPALFFFSVAS